MIVVILFANGIVQGVVTEVPPNTPLHEVLDKWCNANSVPNASRHRYYAKSSPLNMTF